MAKPPSTPIPQALIACLNFAACNASVEEAAYAQHIKPSGLSPVLQDHCGRNKRLFPDLELVANAPDHGLRCAWVYTMAPLGVSLVLEPDLTQDLTKYRSLFYVYYAFPAIRAIIAPILDEYLARTGVSAERDKLLDRLHTAIDRSDAPATTGSQGPGGGSTIQGVTPQLEGLDASEQEYIDSQG